MAQIYLAEGEEIDSEKSSIISKMGDDLSSKIIKNGKVGINIGHVLTDDGEVVICPDILGTQEERAKVLDEMLSAVFNYRKVSEDPDMGESNVHDDLMVEWLPSCYFKMLENGADVAKLLEDFNFTTNERKKVDRMMDYIRMDSSPDKNESKQKRIATRDFWSVKKNPKDGSRSVDLTDIGGRCDQSHEFADGIVERREEELPGSCLETIRAVSLEIGLPDIGRREDRLAFKEIAGGDALWLET